MARVLFTVWAVRTGRMLRPVPVTDLSPDELTDFWADDQLEYEAAAPDPRARSGQEGAQDFGRSVHVLRTDSRMEYRPRSSMPQLGDPDAGLACGGSALGPRHTVIDSFEEHHVVCTG